MKTLRLKKVLATTLAITAWVFLFCGVACANVQKPLHTWANTQVAVFNSDYDNQIHFEITYDLDALLAGVDADGSINLGPFHNRWRGRVLRADFPEIDLTQLVEIG